MFKKHTYLLFLFVFTKSIGQETLKGKIISVIDNFKEVLVVNQTRNTFTNIDINGQFEIDIFLNDTSNINSKFLKK